MLGLLAGGLLTPITEPENRVIGLCRKMVTLETGLKNNRMDPRILLSYLNVLLLIAQYHSLKSRTEELT